MSNFQNQVLSRKNNESLFIWSAYLKLIIFLSHEVLLSAFITFPRLQMRKLKLREAAQLPSHSPDLLWSDFFSNLASRKRIAYELAWKKSPLPDLPKEWVPTDLGIFYENFSVKCLQFEMI